ncbi:maleate cis-trans isomerase family protein [Rhizobium mongolense]|uniref:Maleate isomerase n=1 Tax=Rhizobium mongolense TaxID=57676 RepID=A0A7W6WG73_9HYPH|nr:hypothetical protein [Rhizobium mongolense]MBB4276695.1 maleate isomerase [Rhizobium mongolense]
MSTSTSQHDFEEIAVARYDEGPGKYRIGLIATSNDYTTERDFINMRPTDDVALFTSRVQFATDCSVPSLNAMAARITEAAALLVPEGRLDVIAYSCTSGTAAMGFERVRDLIHAARPGVACTTPLTAAAAAFDRLGAHRISVLTPYTDDVNSVIADNLVRYGTEISSFSSFKILDNELMARLAPETIYDAAVNRNYSGSDALFISCTAIRAVEVAARIEAAIGKPVITAVQALYWHALRLAGCQSTFSGYGQLLEA